jgi:hypothetical protein
MRIFFVALLLFLAQICLVFFGVRWFGKYWSPVVLLGVSLAIGICWLRILLRKGNLPNDVTTPVVTSGSTKLLGALVGMLGMLSCYEELRKLFVRYNPPGKISDVLPQLETLYMRFAAGEMPYQPVDVGTHVAYPVYLPLHWLPVGISNMLHFDTRWSGYALLVMAAGIYGFFVFQHNKPLIIRIVAALFPALVLWGYVLWGREDIPVSYELVIASYYLVLAVSLSKHRTVWIAFGLILCLLSRYTLVFWVPLFAVLFWQNASIRASALLWLSVITSALALYVVPFLLKDTSAFLQGIAYHNGAAVAEWTGYGDPPVSWTMQQGIHFALHLRELGGGDAEHGVFIARMVQATAMLFLLFAGLRGYRLCRNRIHYGDFSLLMLYFFILFFYNFGPLAYRYYLIVPLVLSAVICGRIIIDSSTPGRST